jgi:hypothetical protein
MGALFNVFGNKPALERAISAALPDPEGAGDRRKTSERLQRALAGLQSGRERLVRLIARGKLTEGQAEKELDSLNERERILREELAGVKAALEEAPSPEEVKAVVEAVGKRFLRYSDPKEWARRMKRVEVEAGGIEAMSWEEKKELVQWVFGGKDAKGERLGVRVRRVPGRERGWRQEWEFVVSGVVGLELSGDTRVLEPPPGFEHLWADRADQEKCAGTSFGSSG